MTDTALSPDAINAMRAQVAAYDSANAAAAVAAAAAIAGAEAARVLPVQQLCATTAYQGLLAAMPDIVSAYGEDAKLGVHVNCLALGLANLATVAGPVPVAAPVTTPSA